MVGAAHLSLSNASEVFELLEKVLFVVAFHVELWNLFTVASFVVLATEAHLSPVAAVKVSLVPLVFSPVEATGPAVRGAFVEPTLVLLDHC